MRSLSLSLVALSLVVAFSGCGQSRTTETSGQSQSPSPNPNPGDTTTSSSGSEATGRRIPPSWAAPLQQGEVDLTRMIEQGTLTDVRAKADEMAGLLNQIASDGERLGPEKRQALEGHLTAARRHLEELQDAAAAGNTVRAQDVLPQLRSQIRSIEEVFALGGE